MRNYFYRMVAKEISKVARYAREVCWVESMEHDDGTLEQQVVADGTSVEAGGLQEFPGQDPRPRVFVLNGSLNYSLDCEAILTRLSAETARRDRVAIVMYNPYLRPLYWLANLLGLRRGPYPTAFLSNADLSNIARITGFEVLKQKWIGFLPGHIWGLGTLINRVLAEIPIIRSMGLSSVVWLRPLVPHTTQPSLSIVVPARNEAGNIDRFFEELPPLPVSDLEIILVEGNSSDGTWDAIQQAQGKYADQYKILTLQQPGKGKFDAVKHGFAAAQMELLAIVDADLTMPPTLLGRFLDAYANGHGDFINGNRLLYPMEFAAMRPLNYVGNRFFAKFVAYVLGVSIGDSLCGTKLFHRGDYLRQCQWRQDFGEFDPFGDFEMLFSASALELGMVDVPIRYRSRTYGTTQIDRFRDGLVLFKMCLIALVRIKFR